MLTLPIIFSAATTEKKKNMRADLFLFSGGHTKSRQEARKLIESGDVKINGRTVKKPSEQIYEQDEQKVEINNTAAYVSRGGLKLDAALFAFAIDVNGMRALDIGASTGGFTDCLLSRGAAQVTALDAGHGQLDARLAADPRVKSIEGFNARALCEGGAGCIGDGFDIAVMDVSFISQTYIIPGLPGLLVAGGYFIGLVKPQFEAGRTAVGKGGIVRDRTHHAAAIARVADCAGKAGFGWIGFIPSPIKGGDGNTEYLAAFQLGGGGEVPDTGEIKRLIMGF